MRHAGRAGLLALALVTPLLALPGPEAMQQYQAGLDAKRAGRLDVAAAELRGAVRLSPDYEDAHWVLAWVEALRGRSADAAAEFSQVLLLKPKAERAEQARAALARLGYATVRPTPVVRPAPAVELPRGPAVTLRGEVEAVDPAVDALQVRVTRRRTASRDTAIAPVSVRALLGEPGIGQVSDGHGRRVALERVRPGDPVELATAPGPRTGGLLPLDEARVELPPELVRLPSLAFEYTETWLPEPAYLSMVFPVLGGAGWYDDYGAPRGEGRHLGVDVPAPKMSPLLAPFDGVVTLRKRARWPGDSYTVVVTRADGWSVLYTHLNDDHPGTTDQAGGDRYAFAPGIAEGRRVVQGQLVGYVGKSGVATGTHVHVEIRAPGFELRNPATALRTSEVRRDPHLAPMAPGLLPPRPLTRFDGWLADVDRERPVLAVDLRASRDAGGRWNAYTQPNRQWFRVPDGTLGVLGAAGQEVPVCDLRPGTFVILFGAWSGNSVRVERGAVALRGVLGPVGVAG